MHAKGIGHTLAVWPAALRCGTSAPGPGAASHEAGQYHEGKRAQEAGERAC